MTAWPNLGSLLSPSAFQIRHDGSNSYRLMQLGCLESVANSTVAYSSTSPLTYSTTGTEFASPYFSTNHQYTPLHHQSFHYEFQHSHPAVNPDAYSLNSLHHSQQYYQQIHHGEPGDFINLHNARALKSSCLDEPRRELGCLDAYRRHDLSLMSHGSQYGMHPDQRLLPGSSLGLAASGADELQVKSLARPPGRGEGSTPHSLAPQCPTWATFAQPPPPPPVHTVRRKREAISLHSQTHGGRPAPAGMIHLSPEGSPPRSLACGWLTGDWRGAPVGEAERSCQGGPVFLLGPYANHKVRLLAR